MPIRKHESPDEPLGIHRLVVDPQTHPSLHRALLNQPFGKPRVDFIRDQLEALLALKPEGLEVAKAAEPSPRRRQRPVVVPAQAIPEPMAPIEASGAIEHATPVVVPIDEAPVEAVTSPRVETPEEKAARLAAADSLFSFQSDL